MSGVELILTFTILLSLYVAYKLFKTKNKETQH